MTSSISFNKKPLFIRDKDLILLLQPPITVNKEDIATFGIFPPLGLAYLASPLEQASFNVEIIDLVAQGAGSRRQLKNDKVRVGLSEDEIIEILINKNPKIVGISNNFTAFSNDAISLAKIVRQALPDALIVMGGAHASMEYESILNTANVDCVVIGEGEQTFVELVKSILSGDGRELSIKGTVWQKNGSIIRNDYREPIQDLDALPIPAYHLLSMESYIWQKQANFAYAMRYPIGHMITSRGCINNCIFCSTTKHFKKFRKRSVDNVIAEIKFLTQKYGIKEIHFHDDSFMADIERVRLLCNRLIDEKIDIKWQVSQGINSNRLDRELLRLMRDSGMYRVGFPIESGSMDMLRYMRKPIRLDKVKALIEDCNELGIYCFGCFMIGFPHETKEQIQETYNFILQTGLDYAKVSITQPLAGSELYCEYQKLGLLRTTASSSTYFHTQYDTAYLRADELNEMRRNILKAFSRKRLKRLFSYSGIKRYVLPKLSSPENLRYFLKVSWLALKG
jgi:radical SAM superfamily enzyme YgiQ (UPF0313 family)